MPKRHYQVRMWTKDQTASIVVRLHAGTRRAAETFARMGLPKHKALAFQGPADVVAIPPCETCMAEDPK